MSYKRTTVGKRGKKITAWKRREEEGSEREHSVFKATEGENTRDEGGLYESSACGRNCRSNAA